MAAIVDKCHPPFFQSDWDKKKKMLVILMMLMDEEDSVMLKRRIWCRQWLLRRDERGAYHTIFKISGSWQLKIRLVSLSI